MLNRPFLAAALALFSACAAFVPRPLSIPADVGGVQSQTIGEMTVSAAILTDDQARRHFGVDLGAYQVQAVWMSVRNNSARRLWFIRSLLNPDFYSAEEAAAMIRNEVPSETFDEVRQYFRDESIRSLMNAKTITEGFIFLPKAEGGRYLDISLEADAWDEGVAHTGSGNSQSVSATASARELRFGLPMLLPDGEFDYERLDPAKTYAGRTLPNLGADQLRAELERLPCCVTDADATTNGDPLNIVLVGQTADMLNTLSRSGWSFTHRISLHTIAREIGAVIKGTPYPVAPVSNLYALGRRHDLALQRARESISQRNHMRLWLAPFLFEGRQVWIGQISRDIDVKITSKSPTFTTHIIDPEVDATREYLLHNLVAYHFVDRFGFVTGSARAPRTRPLHNLTDDPYFSDGMRLVIVLSPEPIAASRVRNLMWEQSAAPIAEGQSEAASRNVRPINPTSDNTDAIACKNGGSEKAGCPTPSRLPGRLN